MTDAIISSTGAIVNSTGAIINSTGAIISSTCDVPKHAADLLTSHEHILCSGCTKINFFGIAFLKYH